MTIYILIEQNTSGSVMFAMLLSWFSPLIIVVVVVVVVIIIIISSSIINSSAETNTDFCYSNSCFLNDQVYT